MLTQREVTGEVGSISLLDTTFTFADQSLARTPSPILPAELVRPDLLLRPFDGSNKLASVRTIHAATLFSGGAVRDGQINPDVQLDFSRAREQGITALYVIGMWDSTAFSALWTRHWTPESAECRKWIGPSAFSTDSYFPNHLVGSWENLDLVLDAAHKERITLVPCFVTNTIGMGGALMRETLRTTPQSIMSRSVETAELDRFRDFVESNNAVRSYFLHKESGPSAGAHSLELFHYCYGHDLYRYTFKGQQGEHHESYLQINGKLYQHAWVVDREHATAPERVHCIQLGSEDPFNRGDGSATVWSDTVHRSVHLPQTRELQIHELKPVLTRFPDIRCDMAHLAGVEAWGHYPALARAQGHPLNRMLLETYFEHDQLVQQDRSVSVYANFLFDWLVRQDMNIPAIMWHVHDQRELYHTHRMVAFAENHDEKGSLHLPTKGAQALIIASCPVESVLWGQNQRVGDDFRIAAQLHIPRNDFIERETALLNGELPDHANDSHLHYARFFNRVERLSALPVFRSAESTWRRAVLSSVESSEPERIFHIVRELSDPATGYVDRAMVIVDARKLAVGDPITIDLPRSFNIPVEQMEGYILVDLISGTTHRPREHFTVAPTPGSPEPHSYAFALVPQERAEIAPVH